MLLKGLLDEMKFSIGNNDFQAMREKTKWPYPLLSTGLKSPAVFWQTGTISVDLCSRLHSGSLQALPLYMQIYETSFI